MDVNAIMLENMKKKKGTSSTIPTKVVTKISLPQEGGVDKSIADANKPNATSNVMSKVIEIDVGED